MSAKFVSAILGPEMGAPILWTPGKMRSFCRKNHVRTIPLFWGGGLGGGECRFYFYGRADFSEIHLSKFVRPKRWDDSPVGFRGSNASGGRVVLLPGAFWEHGASKMATLGASLPELRRACFLQARVARAVLLPGALFRSGAFAPSLAVPSNGMSRRRMQGIPGKSFWESQPRGPKDWKNSRFRSGIETFKRPISD